MTTADEQLDSEMPENVNEAFFDSIIRHQIGLMRVSGSIRNDIFDILDATEADIIEQINRRLPEQGILSEQRLRVLLESIREIRNEAWKEAGQLWRDRIAEVARAEPEFLAEALQTVGPVQLDLILPPTDVLRAIVNARPFEGRLFKDWISGIRRQDVRRIEQQIRIGMVQGETRAAISRRIVGTVRQRGRNGVTEITRRNAAGITRTAINAVTNQAKREFYKDNSDIFTEELYVATLDSRTTPICRSLDGGTYPIGEGPIPPVHFNCRSLRVPIIDGNIIGQRPAKSSTERQLIREYNEANGTNARNRATLPRGHKGRFDTFKRRRVRELTGTVDGKVSYQEFLTRQSPEFQDDVLGKTKGRLFRKGGLTLDRFVDRQGNELTLAELASRDKDAFRAAGLDPEDFT